MKPSKLPALLLALSSPLFAGLPGPELVKDIYPGTRGSMDYEEPFAAVGNTLFLGANNKTHGLEFWKSDGTPGGTVLVKDLCNGSHGGSPRDFMATGNLVYFCGHDLTHGSELWRSDGTSAGTFMLRDIASGLDSGSYPKPFGAAGDTLYFSADVERTNGGDLWKSNGTPEGTVKVTTLYPAERVYLSQGTAFGGAYYFRVGRSAGTELWRTDGTAAGTRFISKIGYDVVVAGNRLFFRSTDGIHGKELWSSDGTQGGTSMVTDIAVGSPDGVPSEFIMAAGNLVYFSAQTGSDPSTRALWRSDGTQDGTFPLMPLAESFYGNFHVMENQIYFAPKLAGGTSGLWKSDGTVEGTRPLKTGTPGGQVGFFAHGNKSFYFYSSIKDLLWQSDGTDQGTRVVADLYMGSSGGGSDVHPRSVNGKLLFGVYTAATGKELYSYDTKPPAISPAVISGITTTGVRIEVGINPNGATSSAEFEYGPTEAYGTSRTVFLADGDLISRFQDFPLELSGLSPGTVYHYRIQASNAGGSRISTGTFRTAFTRQTWRTASFGPDADAQVSGDDEDPDGDSLVNLLEYAFGLDPNRADAARLPQPSRGEEELIYEFTHPEGQEDLVYGVEWSPSMSAGSWTAIPDTGGGGYHRFAVPTLSKSRVFMRWTVNPR